MADSALDPKVEDVLSSVRRLVSGEMQRRTSRETQPAGAAGALVLTEALRVAEKPESTTRPESAKRSLEERIAELEAAVDRGSEEFEPDGSEDPSQNRPDRIVYTRPPKSDELADRAALRLSQIALIETGPASDESASAADKAVPFRRETSRDLTEAPMAVDVPTQPATAEVHAFSNPDDVVAGIEARIAGSGRPSETPILDKGGEAKLVHGPQENILREQPKGDDDEFDAALTEAVAASVSSSGGEDRSGAAVGDFLDQDEVLAYVDPAVDASSDDAPTSDADGDGDGTEEVPEAAAVPVSEDDEAPTAAAALDALSDEEALRLLVAQLIREELQGKLGERITSNVRKLVRREVMRALDSRDLV